MNLFKSRLIETGKTLVAVIIVLLIVGCITSFFGGLFWLLDWIYPNLDAYIVMTVLVIGIVCFIGKGLYWLLIEPFRSPKKDDGDEDVKQEKY
jgi:hypothetical protein